MGICDQHSHLQAEENFKQKDTSTTRSHRLTSKDQNSNFNAWNSPQKTDLQNASNCACKSWLESSCESPTSFDVL